MRHTIEDAIRALPLRGGLNDHGIDSYQKEVGPLLAELARLERRAKDWAEDWRLVGIEDGRFVTGCAGCASKAYESAPLIHAHDCDAAHILGLDRESER